ncbi:hypothetical protein E2C01_006332 [Portunus trituberculatus]|uniref:Uncharacterized protein n=1 Tax=Portunus trituberculatus TaxID=210409 RepID=A0A5B7CXW5_PORTR|nr:hypothetical protein [Portunus trituberculatus]
MCSCVFRTLTTKLTQPVKVDNHRVGFLHARWIRKEAKSSSASTSANSGRSTESVAAADGSELSGSARSEDEGDR